MRAWRAEGANDGAIARRLNDAAVPTKRGGTWRPNTVLQILKNADEIGTICG